MEKKSRSPSAGSGRSGTQPAQQGRTSNFAFTTFEPTGSESGAQSSSGRHTTSASSFRSRTSAGQSWRSRPGPSSPATTSKSGGVGGGAEATSPSLFQAVVGTSATSAASPGPHTSRSHYTETAHGIAANNHEERTSKSSVFEGDAAMSLRRTSSFSTSGIFSASSPRDSRQVANGASDIDAGRAFAALSDFLVVSETRMGSGEREAADADADEVRQVDWDEDWSLKNAVVFSSSLPLSAATSGNLLHRAACENHVYDSKRSRGRGRPQPTQGADSLQALLRYYVNPSDESSFMVRLLRQQVMPSNKARPDDIHDLNDLIRDRVLEWGLAFEDLFFQLRSGVCSQFFLLTREFSVCFSRHRSLAADAADRAGAHKRPRCARGHSRNLSVAPGQIVADVSRSTSQQRHDLKTHGVPFYILQTTSDAEGGDVDDESGSWIRYTDEGQARRGTANPLRCITDFSVRGLFDYLLNTYTQDYETRPVLEDIPKLVSFEPFHHATVSASKIVFNKSVQVPKHAGSGSTFSVADSRMEPELEVRHDLRIEGLMCVEKLRQLCEFLGSRLPTAAATARDDDKATQIPLFTVYTRSERSTATFCVPGKRVDEILWRGDGQNAVYGSDS